VYKRQVSLTGKGQENGQVTLGIRPEHLAQDDNGSIKISIQMVEQLGANTLLHGVLDGTNSEMVASVPGHVSAENGSVLSFSAGAENLHLFETSSGKRIDA